MEKQYGVWCTVSGGRTGSRAAWLKADGVVQVFTTYAAARDEAERNQARVSVFSHCMFGYYAKEMN